MMPTYPERRDSGVECIGEIPSHWTVCALKRVLSEPLKYGATEPGHETDPESPRYLRITDFDGDGSLRADTFVSLPVEIARHYYLHDGDVLFARSGATVGKTFLFRDYPGRACFAGYLIKASTTRHKLTPEFLTYFTRSPAYDAWKDSIFTQATIQNIGADKYARLPICLPPLPEQQRIVSYLDASCAAVDVAVAAKRRQLETLDALRESIIERAVTRGLNTNPKLRLIDQDWIGSLPEHWAAVRIKRVISRLDYGISVSSKPEGKYPVLKMGNIQAGEIVFSKMEFVDEVAEELLLGNNDLLYNRTNSPDQVGKAALFLGSKDDAVTFASYLVRLRANHRIIPEFLSYAVNCGGFLAFARRLAIPSVQQSNLNSTRYGRLHIPLPPVTEQRAICEYLHTKMGEMKRVATTIEAQIATLTAYRKLLIHECVTGQRRITEVDTGQKQGSVQNVPAL